MLVDFRVSSIAMHIAPVICVMRLFSMMIAALYAKGRVSTKFCVLD